MNNSKKNILNNIEKNIMNNIEKNNSPEPFAEELAKVVNKLAEGTLQFAKNFKKSVDIQTKSLETQEQMSEILEVHQKKLSNNTKLIVLLFILVVFRDVFLMVGKSIFNFFAHIIQTIFTFFIYVFELYQKSSPDGKLNALLIIAIFFITFFLGGFTLPIIVKKVKELFNQRNRSL